MGRTLEFRQPVLTHDLIRLLDGDGNRPGVLESVFGQRGAGFEFRNLDDMNFVRFYFTEVEPFRATAEERRIAAESVAAPQARAATGEPLAVYPAGSLMHALVAVLNDYRVAGVSFAAAPAAALLTFVRLDADVLCFEAASSVPGLFDSHWFTNSAIPLSVLHWVDAPRRTSYTSVIAKAEVAESPTRDWYISMYRKRLFFTSPVARFVFTGNVVPEGPGMFLGMPQFTDSIDSVQFTETVLTLAGTENAFPILRSFSATLTEIDPSVYPVLRRVDELSLNHYSIGILVHILRAGSAASIEARVLRLENINAANELFVMAAERMRPVLPNLRNLVLRFHEYAMNALKIMQYCSMPRLHTAVIIFGEYSLLAPYAPVSREQQVLGVLAALMEWLEMQTRGGQRKIQLLRISYADDHANTPGGRNRAAGLRALLQPLSENAGKYAVRAQILQ